VRAAAGADKSSMSVDYSLLPHFTATRARLEAARQALPEAWRTDPRPAAQAAAERWIAVRVRTGQHLELVREGGSALPGDDR